MAELWAELPFAAAVAAQVTVWLLIGGAASLAWSRHAARAHRALALAVVAALVTPLGVLLVRHSGWGVVTVPATAIAPAAAPPEAPVPLELDEAEAAPPALAALPIAAEPAAEVAPAATPFDWERIGAGLWGALSVACLLALALSYLRGRRIVAGSRPFRDAALGVAVRRVGGRLGVSPLPRLRTSARVRCPVIWPWRRPPLLLLPTRTADAAVRWDAVLCHELAHLRRRDHLASLASLLLVALIPWHPLAWWARRRLARLGEIACDDRVLADGHPAPDYADSLLRLVPQRATALALPAVASRSGLAKRVRSILGVAPRRPDAGRVWSGVATACCLALAATLALAQEATPGGEKKPPVEFAGDLRPPDRRPASVQIPALAAAIREELGRLGSGGPADAWRKRLASLEAELAGPLDESRRAERELHVVGVYEGEYAPGVGHHSFGTVRVRVERSGVPLLLALSSYEPVDWKVELAEGVVLQRVVASGYYHQRVHGVGETPVMVLSHQGGAPRYFRCYEKSGESYPAYAKWLTEETGLGITTFQGRYSGRDGPFVIGARSADWRAEVLLDDFRALEAEVLRPRRTRILGELSSLRFPAVRHDVRKTAWGEFTVLGPVEGALAPIPGGFRHVARDPATGRFFALTDHDVLTFEPGEKRATKLDLGPDIAALSWPSGLAFDTKRRRLLVVSRSGQGHLWAHDVERKTWTGLRNLGDLDLAALAYDGKRDRLLGIGQYPGSSTWLFTLDPEGKLIRKTSLDRKMPDGISQLIPAGDRAILLVNAGQRGHIPVETPARCYVLDRSTGKTLLALRQKGE
ncbi:MAG: M56 family metallopeptidase [Planctomycetota bacterium]|jgi:beta-lactamase regulating signal transducer with metallopeptidase domain